MIAFASAFPVCRRTHGDAPRRFRLVVCGSLTSVLKRMCCGDRIVGVLSKYLQHFLLRIGLRPIVRRKLSVRWFGLSTRQPGYVFWIPCAADVGVAFEDLERNSRFLQADADQRPDMPAPTMNLKLTRAAAGTFCNSAHRQGRPGPSTVLRRTSS